MPRQGVKPWRRRGYGFAVPPMWPWDRGKRLEAMLDCDHSLLRVARRIGWRCCIKCAEPFFSGDVVKQRLCLLHRKA
jgi:hypothetical protein